jgi:hypothetical protein
MFSNISKQSWRWKAVRNFFGMRQTIMHAFKQQCPTRPKSQLATETPAKIIRRPKAEVLVLAPVIKPGPSRSFFYKIILPESGVPFSPLND